MPKRQADSDEHVKKAVGVPYGYQKVSPGEKRKRVQRHFDEIARRYDLAYILLSFGLCWWWRRTCLHTLNLKADHRLLDLCGGTGDLARTAVRTGGTLSVVCDLNRPMMDAGRRKTSALKRLQWVHGNAESLGFCEAAFDAVFVGLGLRNLVHVEKGLREMFRILKGNGRLAILEFSVPSGRSMKAIYNTYAFRLLPALGRVVTGAQTPFQYLAESVCVFPKPECVGLMLRGIGFTDVAYKPLSKGIVTLYTAKKPSHDLFSPAVSRKR